MIAPGLQEQMSESHDISHQAKVFQGKHSLPLWDTLPMARNRARWSRSPLGTMKQEEQEQQERNHFSETCMSLSIRLHTHGDVVGGQQIRHPESSQALLLAVRNFGDHVRSCRRRPVPRIIPRAFAHHTRAASYDYRSIRQASACSL